VTRRMLATVVLMFGVGWQAQSQESKINDPTAPGKPRKQIEPAKGLRADTPVEGVKWVRFEDPNEHAFSVDVPEGWKVEGGLIRRNFRDVSDFLRALSPDHSMMLMAGDPGPAMFHSVGFAPMPEDRAYVPGKTFARSYAESILPVLCSEAKFVSDLERVDIERSVAAKPPPISHFDAGEVVFSCVHQGQQASAYMLAGTWVQRSRGPDAPDIWGVDLLVGCIGPSGELDRCRKMVQHLLSTAKTYPEWSRADQEKALKAARDLKPIDNLQTPEWEANRKNAAAQMKEMDEIYNPPQAVRALP
jgi:hypothetical protein